jgi:BON domain-containing protein/PRC-barrel domain protein
MQRMVKKLVSVAAGLGVAGLAFAQGTPPQTAPGTVPVPKPGSGAPGSTPAPAAAPKAAAKKPEAIQNTKRFAEHTGLARTSDLVGLSVKDASGKDAGKIEDLLTNSRGQVAYAVVSFGGILGIGDKLYAVPWNAIVIDREAKTAHLDVTKDTLERAPSFSKDKWPESTDREWGTGARTTWNDASITASVKSKLAMEKAATLLKVNVDTTQGVVQLNGTVDNERTKQRATELARQVEGVRKVVNNLKVQS